MAFDLKSSADEIARVVMDHLAPAPGFTFHPVYIAVTAYDPMIDVLQKVFDAGRVQGAAEIAEAKIV